MKKYLIYLSLFCFPSISMACSCMPAKPLKEALQSENYAAIFIGEVTDISIDPFQMSPHKRFPRSKIITFTIKKSWKGDLPETVQVVTGGHSGNCGYSFKEDSEYLVFAYVNKKKDGFSDNVPYFTSICTFTKPVSEAADKIKILEETNDDGQRSK